jgi:Viral BACON domain
VGGANPGAQSLNITNTGGGTLSWSTSDNAPWLTVSPASGSGPGAATVSVNTAGLAAGTLNGTITIAAIGAPTKSIPVTLTMTAPSTGAATLNSNASSSSDTVGYKVYKGTASGAYGVPVATLQGSVLSYQAIGLQINTTYFFVVTSYDAAGNENPHSNEVSKSIF